MGKLLFPVIMVVATLFGSPKAEAGKADRYVVYFKAEWCQPCKKMEESWNDESVVKLIKKYRGKVVWEIDIDKYPNEAVKYRIFSVPTVLILDKEGKVLRRAVGYMNAQQLHHFLSADFNKRVTKVVGEEEVFTFPLASIAKNIIYLFAKILLGLLS